MSNTIANSILTPFWNSVQFRIPISRIEFPFYRDPGQI
ncbi:hypothetical protein LEP1GSC178_1783 [Leptospira licerasiae str. MMD4847]|uniref:Uncharacterized protein n=1 Tax=Leptospira licerasiae str. MMD4847 TaxID=1049971 RepID=A0ABN0H4B3_9LEPT|nr:hypothetical protein LEP1GSC178_1783 [Leptospira licerasiae str. MMD4847]